MFFVDEIGELFRWLAGEPWLSDEGRRERLNDIGRAQGFSGCAHCYDRWNWKQMGEIDLGDGESMFPVCRQCQDRLPVERTYRYAVKLVALWVAQGSDIGDVPKTLARIKRSLFLPSNHEWEGEKELFGGLEAAREFLRVSSRAL